ncbi:MAG TPA: hypothetical protein PL133_05515 [Methylophilaceae bacterium]|nr:hypothetical protein [Methylophilaceae bacterium]HPX88704.1 hypothetical protein [Methylophilaceae bacterium]HQC28506.1 hypothetical protein [Methylotenera sp.]
MRTLFIAALSLTLFACVHETKLQSLDGHQTLGRAIITSEGDHAGKIRLERDGKVYSGTWVGTKADESREIARAYGAQSLKYKNYQKGLGSYLRQANTVLQTEQGETLNCEFKYRGTSAKGACQSETDHFEFLAVS